MNYKKQNVIQNKRNLRRKRFLLLSVINIIPIGHFQYSVILLLENFWFLFSRVNTSYCSLLSTGITKFKFEKETTSFLVVVVK